MLGARASADTARIDNSPDLPWSNPSHTSNLEVLAGQIATHIAGRDASVRCEGDTDWTDLAEQRRFNPAFELGYVSIVSCTALIPLGRGWTVTAVSVSSLVISVTLNWFLIPAGHALFGAGGAGIGAGVALTLNEVFSAGALTLALGGRAFDRSGLAMLAKMLVVCAVVVALDRLVLLPYGLARLPVDAAVYGALALLWRAGDYDVLANVASRILSRRRSSHAVAVV